MTTMNGLTIRDKIACRGYQPTDSGFLSIERDNEAPSNRSADATNSSILQLAESDLGGRSFAPPEVRLRSG